MVESNKILSRKIGTLDFGLSQTKSQTLKFKPNLLRAIKLDSLIGITVSSTGGTAIQDNPMTLIKAVRIIVAGKTLKSVKGVDLHYSNKIETGITPYIAGQLAGAISAASYVLRLVTTIPFAFDNHYTVFPETTILNSNAYSDITLEVDFGASTDLVSANTVIDSCVTNIIAVEREPLSDEDRTTPRPEMVDSTIVQTISASNSALQIPLSERTEIKSLFLRAVSNGARSDTLINNVKLVANNGSRVEVNLPFKVLQAINKSFSQIENASGVMDTGIAAIEIDPDGDLSGLFNTMILNNPMLELDVTYSSGETYVSIIERKIVS